MSDPRNVRKVPPRKRILVASEEAGSRQFVRAALERVGHSVIAADQLANALEAVAIERIDLLVIDGYAPEHPDLPCQIVKSIRADPSIATLPVIMLWPRSADARYSPQSWCGLPPDACAYISKPPNPVELWTLVDNPEPGGPYRPGPFVYRPGEWPEEEPRPRRTWWRR